MPSLERLYPNCDTPGTFDLGFCTVVIHSETTAEVIINEGVEVSGPMVEQCFSLLRGALVSPFCLLVNECNSHSYDFHAQTTLGEIDCLLAVALVSDKPLTDVAACCLMRQPRSTHWPMGVFSNREDALALLNSLPQSSLRRQ
ncbi:Uncharacterised protein [Halioglobus japonicus]|nr:Uncharacterised protein [Halioglobus japonicus]